MNTPYEIALWQIPRNTFDDKSVLAQVMGDKPLLEPMLTHIYNKVQEGYTN